MSDLKAETEALLRAIRDAEEVASKEEFDEHPPFTERPEGMEELGARMDRLVMVPILARLQADAERIRELEASCLSHFQREHLEGDGPEIDRWRLRAKADHEKITNHARWAEAAEAKLEIAEARVRELEAEGAPKSIRALFSEEPKP
jgi:hypothetical protein